MDSGQKSGQCSVASGQKISEEPFSLATDHWPLTTDHCPKLHYRVFGPLSTKSVLSNPPLLQKLADEGRHCLAWLEQHHEKVTLDEILAQSLTFAQNAGLVSDDRVIAAIDAVHNRGGQAAMIMLGESVLANRAPQDQTGWHECTIDSQGTRFL